MAAALAFAGASAGLSILSGLFGYLDAQDAAEQAESRGRLLRMEAEADAERYAEQARGFKATQAQAFLKSGVTLEGSPLDILDETARVASENLSAMRSRAQAEQNQANAQAGQLRSQGRAALIGGIAGAGSTAAMAAYRAPKAGAPGNGTAGAGDGGWGAGTGFGYRGHV
jgi:hypothetical protein